MLADTEDLYDYTFLSQIATPQEFPPTSTQIIQNIEDAFYLKCQAFLQQQRKFHECSKAVQKKLVNAVEGNHEVYEKMLASAETVGKITRNLKKLNTSEESAAKKQEFLAKLCEIIKMDSLRQVLLQNTITNENQYLSALHELNQTVLSLQEWDSELNIIIQIKLQLNELLQQAIKKLIKQKLSDSIIRKIIGPFSEPLLRDENVAGVFKNNLRNNRLNHFRVGLNPLVNNINYAQNISELYEKIVDAWVQMLDEEIQLFSHKQVPETLADIPKDVFKIIVQEIIPKLQRNIYKVKEITQVAKIRYYLSQLRKKLLDFRSDDWDPLPKFLVKSQILLEEKLDHQGEKLEIAKYNIYSLASYIPIRQHIQNIKICVHYDTNYSSDVPIQWQKAFKRLATSRECFKHPKNKSLMLFNLNIWYLYDKIIKLGTLSETCKKTIEWCTQKFIELNLMEIRSKYADNKFEHLIDICSNLEGLRKLLYAEVGLLGHEHLRKEIQEQISNKFVEDVYGKLLEVNKIGKEGLEGEQLESRIKESKINLNKYGKMSERIVIYSQSNLLKLLQ